MSIATWKREFFSRITKRMTPLEATRHSLKKWQGLKPANMEKHGLAIGSGNSIEDGEQWFEIDASTCALCERFYMVQANSSSCVACPLYKARGGTRCDCTTSRERMSPYRRWAEQADPEPMIKWLKRTEKMLLREE